MTQAAAKRIVENLEGATIVGGEVEDDEGLHIHLQDGRVLVIAGFFAMALVRPDERSLH